MNYEMLNISAENIVREKQVFEDILQCIKNKKSWVFDAGAGAGKTYALVETLRLLIKQKGQNLETHNQKILCITYTNVAADEIKKRLGETTLIDVSTIHDCVWGIIAPHQKQLVSIHRAKILDELTNMKNSLKIESWAEKYQCLSELEKQLLQKMMNEQKENYYKYRQDKADVFRAELSIIDKQFPVLLKNVTNFQKIVSCIFKIQKYEQTVVNIDEKNMKFSKVKYDARFNDDRLEKMRISHDTLLDYTKKIIDENDILKQMICDQYPFVLVDEYQDTSRLVIETLSMIEKHAKKIAHVFLVGYYGDVKQNIYEEGVGSRFRDIHQGLERIEKVFNRRCSPKIISIANKIRNDGLIQESIYQDYPESNVFFYEMEIDRQDFINEYIARWNIDEENKLHCFELTNEKVAKQSGFEDIYDFFKSSKWYKTGKRYELLRDHVLSLDEKKLGIVQKLLFRLLDFKYKLNQNCTMLKDVIQENEMKDINISTLRNLLVKLRNIEGKTFREYVVSIFDSYGKGDGKYDKCIEMIVAEDIKSYEELKQFVIDQLYCFSENEESLNEDTINIYFKEIDDFFEINIEIFELWHNFVTDNTAGKIVYHTYHGTKGREFDNVIIFMNSKFGKKAKFFSDLLKVLADKNEQKEIGTEIEKARNLLYVATTRAAKNLCIVYLDVLGEATQTVEEVFGIVKKKL